MKHLPHLIFLSCLLLGCAVKNKQIQKSEESKFTIDARYSAYQTAMGKGRGIIFRVNVTAATEINFVIDSFYVNNMAMPFIYLQNGNPGEIEANYMKSTPEPGYDPNGNSKPNLDIVDPILIDHQFYPSWIILSHAGKAVKLNIENFKKN